MRIGVAGKGGSGKTTITAILSRLLSQHGHAVVAVDADSNPNLGQAIGLPHKRAMELPVLPVLEMVRHSFDEDGNVTRSELAMPPDEILDRYAVDAPDGVRLLTVSRIDHAGTGCNCAAHHTVRLFMEGFTGVPGAITVTDMEAGLEGLKRSTPKHCDTLIVVAEPYWRSIDTAVRGAELARQLGIPSVQLIANKVKDRGGAERLSRIASEHRLGLLGEIPYDEAVMEADDAGLAVLDAAPDSPAVQAMELLAERISG